MKIIGVSLLLAASSIKAKEKEHQGRRRDGLLRSSNIKSSRELQDEQEEGDFYIVNLGTNSVIDVAGGLCNPNNNEANIHLWTREGTPSQLFRFGPDNSIINTGCNMALDLAGGGGGDCGDGTNIQLGDPDGSAGQQWQLKANGAIENIPCAKVMDIAGNNKADGTNVWLYADNESGAQKFTIEYVNNNNGNVDSAWEGPLVAPFVGAAAAALPDGRILLWSSYAKFDFGGGGQTWTSIFDPETKRFTEELVDTPGHDMFCPGLATLADGRIMITGGANSEKTTYFDHRDNSWTPGPDMIIPRGYHTMATLASGQVFTIGGSWSGAVGNKDGELFDLNNNNWALKPGIEAGGMSTNDVSAKNSDYFMWIFQAPNGRIFQAGPSTMMHWIDVENQGSYEQAGLRATDGDAMNGNAVMYDIGKILTVGGSPDFESGIIGTWNTHTIDINDGQAIVTRVGNMAWRRTFANSIVLPTGEVVVIGGRPTAIAFQDADSVLAAEIWSPITGEWTELSQMQVPRNYHAAALLMKDGRILAVGGGLCGNGCAFNHADAEIFTPPYLQTTAESRPVIMNAPLNVEPGDTIQVQLDANHDGATFVLIRMSTVTHSTNTDQRRIPLEVIAGDNDGSYDLRVPSNTYVVPPGSYYLFAMDGDGTPSVAASLTVPINDSGGVSPMATPAPEPTRAPVPAPTAAPVPGAGTQYLGCFQDDPNRVMPTRLAGEYGTDQCIEACRNAGHPFAGLQYFDECWCGTDYDTYGQVEESACSSPCRIGDGVCGGGYLLSVYSTMVVQSPINSPVTAPTAAPVPPIAAPTAAPNPETPTEYLGCFQDDRNRVMPTRLAGDYGTDQCIEACRNAGHPFAGLQYFDECWCGTEYDTYGQVEESSCNSPCTIGDGVCGGGYLLSVYSTMVVQSPINSPVTAPTAAPVPPIAAPTAAPTPAPPESSSCDGKCAGTVQNNYGCKGWIGDGETTLQCDPNGGGGCKYLNDAQAATSSWCTYMAVTDE